MGTYTTNKNLFMPTVGEQGWGELVNNNFSTIDNFLKPITVSGSTYTFSGNHVGNQSGGSVSATSITNSGTLTQTGTSTFTGKITANGGIGTTALTTSSTITSTGVINANGGVNGKLNISSVGTNSNNIKICTLKASNQTLTGTNTLTLSASQVTVTRHNTSFLNCTLTDAQLKSKQSATCSWTWSMGNASGSATFIVKDGSGTTVLNKTVTVSANQSASVSFTRNFGTTYTITKNNTIGACTISTTNGTVYAG